MSSHASHRHRNHDGAERSCRSYTSSSGHIGRSVPIPPRSSLLQRQIPGHDTTKKHKEFPSVLLWRPRGFGRPPCNSKAAGAGSPRSPIRVSVEHCGGAQRQQGGTVGFSTFPGCQQSQGGANCHPPSGGEASARMVGRAQWEAECAGSMGRLPPWRGKVSGTQHLTNWHPKCPGQNRKSLLMSRTRKITTWLKKDSQQAPTQRLIGGQSP